jgi:hypothetical protein
MWRIDQYVGVGLVLIVAGLAGSIFRLQDWALLFLLVPAVLSAAVWFRFRARFAISILATEFAGLALLLYSFAVGRDSARLIGAVMVLMALLLLGARRQSFERQSFEGQ